jgi:hypothetical protein
MESKKYPGPLQKLEAYIKNLEERVESLEEWRDDVLHKARIQEQIKQNEEYR